MSQVYPITDADLYHVLLHMLRLSLLQAQLGFKHINALHVIIPARRHQQKQD